MKIECEIPLKYCQKNKKLFGVETFNNRSPFDPIILRILATSTISHRSPLSQVLCDFYFLQLLSHHNDVWENKNDFPIQSYSIFYYFIDILKMCNLRLLYIRHVIMFTYARECTLTVTRPSSKVPSTCTSANN